MSAKHKLQTLQRRAAWLRHRVTEARAKGIDLTYDVSEAEALEWAVRRLTEADAEYNAAKSTIVALLTAFTTPTPPTPIQWAEIRRTAQGYLDQIQENSK